MRSKPSLSRALVLRAAALMTPALFLGGGCAFVQSESRWYDQLQADGPCWRVDLLDGLDETSTDELHDLYSCVDRQGAIAPLGPVVQALDGQGRTGTALGIDLARLVNGLPDVDVDLFGLLGAALTLLEAEDRPIEPLLELIVELIYGRPYDTVAVAVDLGSQDELDQGVVRPLLPVIGGIATALLDQGDDAPVLLADILEDDLAADLTCTMVGLAETTDPAASALGAAFLPDLGDALVRATDTSNDRWSRASGNSLRDVVVALLVDAGSDGQTALTALRSDLLTLAGDPLVLANLRQSLEDARDQDRLTVLPAQLRYLTQVDTGGGALGPGEDSALLALLRLLDSGNTEVSCSLDLIVTELSVDLGNLSVALLSVIADLDPDAAADGIDVLGDVLGWGLTEATLDLVASSGACPVIDAQLVDDLGAIDRLTDDELGDLLVVLLMVLDDVRSGEEDRLVELVDIAGGLHQRGLVPPLEEVLIDLGSSALASDLVEVVGVALDPSPLQVEACPTGSRPLDFEGLAGGLRAALQDRPGGAPIDVLEPLLQVAVDDDRLWLALGNLGVLARTDGSRLARAPQLFAAVVAADPELELVRDLAPLLTEPTLHGPALRIVEDQALLETVGAPTQDQEGVLPWLSRLVIGGTLDVVLRTVDLVVSALSPEP